MQSQRQDSQLTFICTAHAVFQWASDSHSYGCQPSSLENKETSLRRKENYLSNNEEAFQRELFTPQTARW